MEKQRWQQPYPNIYLIKDLLNSRIIMILIKLQKRKQEELLLMLQLLNMKQKVNIMVMLIAQVTQIMLRTWLLELPEWMEVFWLYQLPMVLCHKLENIFFFVDKSV